MSGVGAGGVRADRLLIGIGMIPRGEVGLIFASIGLSQGVLDDELYGALLLVVLLTTVVTPPLLRWRIKRRGDVGSPARSTRTPRRGAGGGWVAVARTGHRARRRAARARRSSRSPSGGGAGRP